MSSLSSDEGTRFSTQDQETFKRLISMDRESFLANYTGLESTKQIPVKKLASDTMDTDSDDSMELNYLEQLRNPQPTPVVVQEQKPVEKKPVIQGPTRTRTLRQRQASQLKPYTTEKQRYDALLRGAQYHELLERDTQQQHRRRKTAEDRYEQDDRDESDDEEYEAPSLDPEELPTQSMEKLSIVPNRRRSVEKINVSTKPSRTSHSETPPPYPSNDIWTMIPRASTTYASKKKKGRYAEKGKGRAEPHKKVSQEPVARSAQDKGKGRAEPQKKKSEEPVGKNLSSHVEDVLRDVFSDLWSDDDANSQTSLDSVLRAEKERLEQDKQRDEASLEVEEEEIHYNGRRRRARRIHSLQSESDDDTPLPSNNVDDPRIFDYPMDLEPSYSNSMDDPQIFDIPQSPTEQSKPLPRRRKILKEDDGFVEPDGSEYDRPVRKKKRTTTHGVLPYNFIDKNPPKPSNPPVIIEEMDQDDPSSQEKSPPRSASPSANNLTYRSQPSSSRPRERTVGELIQASSRPSKLRAQHHRSAAQNSRTARNSGSSKSTLSRNRQASSTSSSSHKTSITPRKPKHKRADPNGKLYIVPGPDWTSFKRPHLTNGWAPTGEHRTRSSDQARTTREWTTEIQQWENEYHEPPKSHSIQHLQQQQRQIPDDPSSYRPLASPISSQDTGPTDPFARLLYKHPSLSTDYGIPSVKEGAHLHGTCYIMLGYLKQVLSPEDAVPSIGAFETFIELFGRKITLTQDVDQTIQSIRALFREAFKRIGSFFEKQSTTIPAVAKELEITKLMPFFRFVSERLTNWALRLGGGQQRPTMELLNKQCKLLYTRAWATAGMAIPYDQYNKTPPLLDNRESIGHSLKVLLTLFIYALDWMARFGTAENQDDCKQRLLWLLYWIGPEYAQLLRNDDDGLTAEAPLVAEAWICVLHRCTPNECWQKVMHLLERQAEQDGWTASQKRQRMFHWLLVLNGLRHVDSSGMYTTPLTGLASVDGLCGHDLALELITASAM